MSETVSEDQPRELRVLAVTHYPPMIGGSSRSCSLLWQGIARLGHRVHVVAAITPQTRSFDAENRDRTPETLTVSRYEVPDFQIKQYDIDEFVRAQAIEHEKIRRILPELIDRYRPTVMVSAHETLGAAVIDLARSKGLPCALMLRGSPTWQILTGVYPQELASRYLELYRRFDVVIAVGDYMRTGLRELDVNNVTHIPNLLDLQQFSPGPRDPALPARYGLAEDAVVVLHASLMTSRKRPGDVLRSAALTLPQCPKLVYLFLGGEERGRELEEENRRQGTAGRVRFVDIVPYDEMPAHIRLAEIVVLASEGEGLARVSVETQACGRVLISSDILAGREVVTHGKTGLLFRTGVVDDLAAQILRAYGDPGLREGIGRAAVIRAARHEIGDVIERYIQQFSQLALGRENRDEQNACHPRETSGM